MSQSSSSKESSSFEGSSEDPTSTEREQFDVEEEENSTSSSKYESQSDIEAPPPIMQSSFDITSDQITTANSITPISLDKSLTSDAAILNDSSILHNPPVAMQREKSKKDVFLNNFFGVNIKPRVDVPAGYTVQFAGHSKVPFLIKDAVSKAVLESEAADEHLRPAVKLKSCTSLERIRKVYGEGVYLYFDFILFVGIANLILFALACVNVIAHFVIDGWNSDLPLTHLIENFYVSSYSPDVYQYWWWSTLISGASWYAFGPALGRRITVMFKRFGYFDHQDRYRLKSMDIIKDKKGRPKSRPTTSRGRLVLSYILFVIMLLISAIITMGFIVAQESLGQALTAFLVSAFLFVVNLGWKKMCYFLTLLEAHYTWSKFKFHHVLKFYMWRVLSVSVVFLTRFLVRRGYLVDVPLFSWIPNSNSQTNTCGLAALGDQFLYIMIISVFGAELIDLIYNKLYFCFCGMRKQTGKALENGRPEFDIAEQYMELLYRQYVTYLGIPIFPFITVFAFVGAFIDYLVYKYLLLRVCRTPPRLRGSMKNLLVFSSFITATLAIAIWPFGVGWTLAGYDLKERCPGSVFDNSW